MNVAAESLAPAAAGAGSAAEAVPDRRADVEAKQARVATLLQEAGCEGLLVLEPENFAWLTSGAAGTERARCAFTSLSYMSD